MKKVLKGTTLGLKKHALAVALGMGLGLGSISMVNAASPNTAPSSLKTNAPHVYVVRKGDTLWDIAGKFLKKPWRWPEIWAHNRHVKNPHWIYPGDRLLLCSFQGKPLVGKDEGDGCEGIIRRHIGAINLKPQVRVESLDNAIPVINLSDIEVWLYRTNIVAPASLTNTPYIVGAADDRLLGGSGQKVYARGNGLAVGQQYGIYRQTEPYLMKDAHGKEYNAGVELLQVASATSTAENESGDITTLEVTKSYNQEIRRGDLILPEYESDLPSTFYPTAQNEVTSGAKIIRVLGSIGEAAKRSVVTIDRGLLEGAKPGQIFSIYQKGEIVPDIKTGKPVILPQEEIGHLMIFKTFDHLSYAYVLDSSVPIKVGASIQAPSDSE
ncbi:LysM peptidoglycan-binding domain-containing protein [Acinetobacter sp. MB5]|uniref:LysM peptidoglycan-binding domain-containing protein n=1 Tax=Acinetobacter sp. MB5 TaxID=2069438 RepID=UPI000DD09B65|nr:LysM domain-containing protein [Acinetobacter sp. MB5]